MDSGEIDKPCFDWIVENTVGKVNTLKIYRTRIKDERAYTESLRGMANSLCLIGWYKEKNAPVVPYDLSFNVERLHINNEDWLSLNHLIDLSRRVKILSFDEVSLTSKMINDFLKLWISSELSIELSSLAIQGEGYEFRDLLAGIRYQISSMAEQKEERGWWVNENLNVSQHLFQAYKIKRNSGVEAHIIYVPKYRQHQLEAFQIRF
ncbi:hypothetical protein CAEBREN_13643 [Caenorhabditis brenneri]|uniref:Sdz-33 F-box domain-containing protein n=1 Tax=Caenorhabditis brenneri TaxID=135651 RepID=G0MBS9_CAEBE|nr:hypothetical protein CAEBREN_13643 [Caenorhabditis brenneri]